MADKKISELDALTGATVATDDQLVIVDTSAGLTKSITIDEFKNALDTATGFVRITGDTMTGDLDIQGTLTSDGLTVDGIINLQGTGPSLYFMESDTTDVNTFIANGSGGFTTYTVNDAQNVFKTRINLDHATGDISFYEDTGTTAKFFWDASAESLGIGTDSPSDILHIESSTVSTGLRLHNTNTGGGQFRLLATSDTASIGGGNLAIYDQDNAAYRFVIDSSGNVGIGTSSPSAPLTVETSSTTNLDIKTTAVNGTAQARFSNDARTYSLGIDNADSFFVYDATGTSTRMTIDSLGNLLVGTTDSSPFNNNAGTSADFGFAVNAGSGYTSLASYNTTPLYINRTSSDGDIVNFRKDGTTVGSIGSIGGDIYVGTDSTTMRFTGSDIRPTNSTGANNDNAIDLGDSAARFKDLYLSGDIAHKDAADNARLLYDKSANLLGNAGTYLYGYGVYLGGTGSANLLDDYEYGDYQVSLTTSGGGSITVSGSHDDLKYTKIGSRVFVSGKIDISAASSPTGYIKVTLPFVIHNSGTVNDSRRFTGSIWVINSALNTYEFQLYGVEGESVVRIYNGSGTSLASTSADQFSGDEGICFDFHYETTP